MKYILASVMIIWLSTAEAASSLNCFSVSDTLAPVLDSALYRKGKKQRVASKVLFITGGSVFGVGLLIELLMRQPACFQQHIPVRTHQNPRQLLS